MPYLSPQAVAHMRATVYRDDDDVRMMDDLCQRLEHTETSGDYGYGAPTYAEGDELHCAFVPRVKRDALEGTDVVQVDADLYFPLETEIGSHDRVKITHLSGEEVHSPQTYAIVGGPLIRLVTIHLQLRLVTE